ncbi:carboxymuconolactone decarboxylase family protein [Vannielia litorea]|uniref:carboxymuconolactone decarboxylase family protein n=1 Tax=Vannielia litorea TaxID=1217970 RepID=UPI001BCE8E16|nr:carboxymuconolactone decarboxylase family protein [Vannielia litorea]MBS8227302.1 carboxymuconolactone decarboxylase family protein [Vannielia litorea]
MSESGLGPIPDADWPEEIADLRDGFAGQLNVYRTMAHDPALVRAWAPLRQHLVKDSALGPERSEIVILRVGVRLGSAYEWAHHVSRARSLGMEDARIAAVRDAGLEGDRQLVRAVDAMLDDHQLPAALEAELRAEIGTAALFDLIATVGFYLTLGTILNTYDVPVDAAIAEEMAVRPL